MPTEKLNDVQIPMLDSSPTQPTHHRTQMSDNPSTQVTSVSNKTCLPKRMKMLKKLYKAMSLICVLVTMSILVFQLITCNIDRLHHHCVFRQKEFPRDRVPRGIMVVDKDKLKDILQTELAQWRTDERQPVQNSIDYKDGYFIVPKEGWYNIHFQLGVDSALKKSQQQQIIVYTCLIKYVQHTDTTTVLRCDRRRENGRWSGICGVTINNWHFTKGDRIAVTVNQSLVSYIDGNPLISVFEMKYNT